MSLKYTFLFLQAVEMGPGGVPKGAQTSDYYRINDIPGRFDNPGNYRFFDFITLLQ